MKAKQIKHGHSYALVLDEKLVAFAHPEDFRSGVEIGKLSLKNCQAIENGYDLDELAYSSFPNGTYETSEIDLGLDMYKLGFQKALELVEHRLSKETEWQVEIVMDICGDKVYVVPEPALDDQGCLILKRIDN